MTFIRFKKFGKQEYAYEIHAKWDKKNKKPIQTSKYLGVVVDKEKKIFNKLGRQKNQEQLILDFGDSYLLHKFIEKNNLSDIIQKVFPSVREQLLALIYYKLCYGAAMMYAETWHAGNYSRILFKNANLSGQRISELLIALGNERIQQNFFSEYIAAVSHSSNGIIIDATSLPNQIHMPLSAWGLSGEDIDKQMRFLLVVDKKSGSPLYFRALPGNIVDVSTLENTLQELKKYKITNVFIYMDAGFFSEDNIKELQENNIHFLTRLPQLRILYKNIIKAEVKSLEAVENIVRYGKRGLFIKQIAIELFGKRAYAYVVMDPQRKGRELTRYMINLADEKDEHNPDELSFDLLNKGVMVLVSSFKLSNEEVVPAYYVRQTAEKLFGFSKDDISLLPLRVHSEEAVRGFLLLQFLSLIVFDDLKKILGKDYTCEEALLIMRNLKCKIYPDEILVSEATREQREIAERLGFIMPKKAGI